MLYAGWLVSCYNPETKNAIFKGPFCTIDSAQDCARNYIKVYLCTYCEMLDQLQHIHRFFDDLV